jgi:rod shape-determining protein MreB
MLHGLGERLQSETGMPFRVAHDPQHAVVRGSGHALEEFEVLKGILFADHYDR